VHLISDKYVVVATDPCTGVPEEWFGWLLVNYASSDVALFGAKPEFCTITLMAPLGTTPQKFQKAMQQICNAANQLDIAIVRGHTGTYGSITELVGVCTVYGTTTKGNLLTPANAKPSDLILCTKPIELETAVNFALTRPNKAQQLFGAKRTTELATQVKKQTCVQEALALAKSGSVHAMHDVTEGGLIAALNELSEASGLGFTVDWNELTICPEAKQLQKHFKLTDDELLAMSSTGTILAAVNPNAAEEIRRIADKNGFEPKAIGKLTNNKNRIILRNKEETAFPLTVKDPYTKILSEE
jgi:hydrogenase expression/formation protein HypE